MVKTKISYNRVLQDRYVSNMSWKDIAKKNHIRYSDMLNYARKSGFNTSLRIKADLSKREKNYIDNLVKYNGYKKAEAYRYVKEQISIRISIKNKKLKPEWKEIFEEWENIDSP